MIFDKLKKKLIVYLIWLSNQQFLTELLKMNRKSFYIQPSPSRSTKSGNSIKSSNSVRANTYASPKPAATNNKTSSAKSSQQNSFDEVDDTPVPEGLVRCPICKRNFAEDRIEKHQVICQKMKTKKRKTYDSSKKRVQVGSLKNYLFFQL